MTEAPHFKVTFARIPSPKKLRLPSSLGQLAGKLTFETKGSLAVRKTQVRDKSPVRPLSHWLESFACCGAG